VTPELPTAFRVSAVDLVRDGRLLLDQVSFEVAEGSRWALLGPNGAGKSTLLRLLATYLHPTRGEVEIFGHRLGQVEVFTLRPQVALVSAHHQVQLSRTARQVVLTGVTGTLDLAARWSPSADDVNRADQLLKLLGLTRLADARWSTMSQGERARTLIARALIGDPRALLLDEPAAGLDVAGREQLLASIAEVAAQRPALATVLVTHHLEELPASTTHALLLRDGRMLAAGPAEAVLTSELVSRCFDHPLTISRHAGRWTAAAGSWSASWSASSSDSSSGEDPGRR
jgi:iron complex transport system ATP-binding protein